MKAMWLWCPRHPGTKVLVVRGFWANLLNPPDMATDEESFKYLLFMAALQNRRFND